MLFIYYVFSWAHCPAFCASLTFIFIYRLQEGVAPINLIVENDLHRASPGGTGGVKTIGNYAAVR